MLQLTFWKSLLLAILCVLLPIRSTAYNIDLPSYVRHTYPPNTMFGFSLAFHKDINEFQQWSPSLIVGAPKFNTSAFQPGVIEAGAIFKCSMKDDDCTLVPFDSQGNNKNVQNDFIDRKSYQWMGATVSTSRDNNLIVACAPRFVYHTMTPRTLLRYDPVGTCFTSRNFQQFFEVSPCRTNNWGYHRQGSCQAGFSAAVSRNGDRLYIGAPGSWYWQGQAYSISPDAKFPYKPPFYQAFGIGGQTYSLDPTRPINQVFKTPESGSQYDDSYLGYSMATGDFNSDGVDDVAIGMPRGASLLGKVVVNSWNMLNIVNITGRQIGEYFGYAVAASDVDGDGLDDLIVGAPMYSETGNVEGKYDVGRVFIFLQAAKNNGKIYSTEIIRDGYNSKGRFGLALTSLGDINQDGFGDFAVGAPYDGIEGRGAVYVFHGSSAGPLQKPSQIIRAEDLVQGMPYPRTFGFALTGGVDMDGNTYPDLAVGAYDSTQVFIFKSRPVAAVAASVSFVDSSKFINLDEKKCQTLHDGKYVACSTFTTCWSYIGKHLPETLEFEMSWILDAKKPKNPRMFFLNSEGKNIRNQSVTLHYGNQLCRNETVYLSENIQDKLTPLEVETRYNLPSKRPPFEPLIRHKRQTLEPVIDQNRDIVQRDAINIQKNCGPDNICIPDLKLSTKTTNNYLLGSPNPLMIEVFVTNLEEDAFEAAFYMIIPKDLDYIKTEVIGDKKDTTVTCAVPAEANNYTLKCDIGNPLQTNKMVNFKVIMTPSKRMGISPSYDFFMEVNSTNVENSLTLSNNVVREHVNIWVKTDLIIEGNSKPEYQLYKASDYKAVENATTEDDLGPQVVHIYNILNDGPSAVEEAVILIHYPYETSAGDILMYLTNQPETFGNIQCDPAVMVNPRNLKLNPALTHKSYLELSGAVVRSGSTHNSAHIQRAQEGASEGRHVKITLNQDGNELSVDERKRLQKEDQQDVTGDASFVHVERAKAASEAQNTPIWTVQNDSVTEYSQSLTNRDGSVTNNRINTQYGSAKPVTVHFGGSSPAYNNLQQSSVEKSHQGLNNYGGNDGSGFHTNTLDLGVLNRENVDQEMRLHTGNIPITQQHSFTQTQGQTFPQEHHQTFRTSSGTSPQVQSYQQSYSSSSGNLPQSGYHQSASISTMPQVQSYQQSFSSSSGNVPQSGYQQSYKSSSLHNYPSAEGSTSFISSEKPYYGMEQAFYDDDSIQHLHGHQPNHHRVRRDSELNSSEQQITQIDLNSPCKTAKCQTLRCVAKNLGKDDGVWVAIRTRMVAKTMDKLSSTVPLNISTMAVSHVTRVPYIGEPKQDIIKSHEIFFKAIPEPIPEPDVVPLWVVVLAACLGALILLLLIFLLYKCGFFKRNRPIDHSTERQPLRNGYHGDEHL